ncbi:RING finger domain-containing protein, partial [Sansalvadorimonas verongulae]|uniref:RING finger domain-containing protein n=1 Tax=Sansalvadorimonas verongulae TaxID=2172824 RepID=UPI0018AD1417
SHKKNPLTTCKVCLEGFRWQDNMHSTTCHHLFHSKCLLGALKGARHCPVCLQPQPVYKPMR